MAQVTQVAGAAGPTADFGISPGSFSVSVIGGGTAHVLQYSPDGANWVSASDPIAGGEVFNGLNANTSGRYRMNAEVAATFVISWGA